MFGAIARRNGGAAQSYPAWRPVSLQDQWDRFTAEVPQGEPPVLSREHFADWGEQYLDTDRDQPHAHSAERQDAKRTVVRHCLRLGRRSRL